MVVILGVYGCNIRGLLLKTPGDVPEHAENTQREMTGAALIAITAMALPASRESLISPAAADSNTMAATTWREIVVSRALQKEPWGGGEGGGWVWWVRHLSGKCVEDGGRWRKMEEDGGRWRKMERTLALHVQRTAAVAIEGAGAQHAPAAAVDADAARSVVAETAIPVQRVTLAHVRVTRDTSPPSPPPPST